MQYKFHAYGHPNILATHKTTLEFTRDREVTLKGNCIIGVKADFELKELKDFIKRLKDNKVTITIKSLIQNKKYKIQEKITAEINPAFNSSEELVIRKTNFISKRTFATSSNKAALELKRDLIYYLKEKKNKILIIIENKQE